MKSMFKSIYQSQLDSLKSHQRQKECCFIYGPASVGKTFMFSGTISPFADVVDCTQMATLVKAIDQVDLALEYLELRF